MTETGIKRTDEGVFCEKCGNDLSKEGSVELNMHIDGADTYTNAYTCKKCGAEILQTVKRNPNSFQFWEG